MREDYVGAATNITYALKGDQVKVIKEEGDMALVENSGSLFHVKLKRLSTDPIEPNKGQSVPLKTPKKKK